MVGVHISEPDQGRTSLELVIGGVKPYSEVEET